MEMLELSKENECKSEFSSVPVLNSDELCEKQSNSPDPILSSFKEEVSYHELRCLSNEDFYETNYMLPMEYEECDDIINIIEQPQHSEHNFHKFYMTNSENCISSTENTDDQLFIEIVKEEISIKHEQNESTSIFDSMTFSNQDENIEHIQLVENVEKIPKNETATPARFILFKKPQDMITASSEIHKFKEKYKNIRKPLDLANYQTLITQAIKSSPQKRMILTEIYSWLLEHISFFREKELLGKHGWKNCIRYTLSVNNNFIRLKDQGKGRSSYWTVYDDFKKYPWTSEGVEPEERKRGRPRIEANDKIVKRRGRPKMKRKRLSIDDVFVTKKRKRGRPRIHNSVQNSIKKLKRGRPRINDQNLSSNKHKRGRPKIHDQNLNDIKKHKRGRPRIYDQNLSGIKKHKRGRPRIHDQNLSGIGIKKHKRGRPRLIRRNSTETDFQNNIVSNLPLVVNTPRRSQRNLLKIVESPGENECIRRSNRTKISKKIWTV